MKRLSEILSIRTLVRAVLPLFMIAALLPAVASAQDPGTGGYAGTAPTTIVGTEPEAAVKDEAVASPPAEAVPAPTATLPFTGLQIAMMIAAGLGLLGLGMALRRISGPALPGT